MSRRLLALAGLALASCASSSESARSPEAAQDAPAPSYKGQGAETGRAGPAGDEAKGNLFGKRPYAIYDPPEDREVSVEAGSWRVAVATDRAAPEPADGWVRIAGQLGEPAADGPRTIRPLEVADGVHAFLYLPPRMAVGRVDRVPVLVLNFRPAPVEVALAVRAEGPIDAFPAGAWTARVEAGRAEVLELEVRPSAEGTARILVQAGVDDGPVPAWQTAEFEVAP